MTPEDGKIEFIIETLARLTAGQEQSHEILVRLDSQREEDRRNRLAFEAWSKEMMSRVTEVLNLQSQRLDRQDEFYRDFLKQTQENQARTEAFQSQALHLLNLLLDRLPPPATV